MEIGKNKPAHYVGLCKYESCFERSEWDLEMEFRVFESVYVNLANCVGGLKVGKGPIEVDSPRSQRGFELET